MSEKTQGAEKATTLGVHTLLLLTRGSAPYGMQNPTVGSASAEHAVYLRAGSWAEHAGYECLLCYARGAACTYRRGPCLYERIPAAMVAQYVEPVRLGGSSAGPRGWTCSRGARVNHGKAHCGVKLDAYDYHCAHTPPRTHAPWTVQARVAAYTCSIAVCCSSAPSFAGIWTRQASTTRYWLVCVGTDVFVGVWVCMHAQQRQLGLAPRNHLFGDRS